MAAFFLRWSCERLLCAVKRPAAGRRRQGVPEEAKEASKALERQRAMALMELHGLVARGAMPWLWLSEPSGWQQLAAACSEGGFCALDSVEALKGRETKQAALQCIVAPLLQAADLEDFDRI